jgi:UDP-N-acetylmuramate--alanine ligase
MDEFAEVLATADELILLDIYAAREEPIEGVSSQVLLDKIQMPDKKLVAKTQLIKLIDSEKPELLVTMGAGDIDRYVELFEELIKSW